MDLQRKHLIPNPIKSVVLRYEVNGIFTVIRNNTNNKCYFLLLMISSIFFKALKWIWPKDVATGRFCDR